MSSGKTRKEAYGSREKWIKDCLADVSEDEGREIKSCKECPMWEGCREEGTDQWNEWREKARQPDGRFGKIWKEASP